MNEQSISGYLFSPVDFLFSYEGKDEDDKNYWGTECLEW